MVIYQEHGHSCIVLLANSVRAERIYAAMVHFVLGRHRDASREPVDLWQSEGS